LEEPFDQPGGQEHDQIYAASLMAKRKRLTGPGDAKKRTIKRRSAVAAALKTPRYRPQVIRNAKQYSRKGKTPSAEEE
jgi:hypothetical protein